MAWIPTVSLLKIPGSMLITLQNTSKSSFVLSRYRQQVVGSCAVTEQAPMERQGGQETPGPTPCIYLSTQWSFRKLESKKEVQTPHLPPLQHATAAAFRP